MELAPHKAEQTPHNHNSREDYHDLDHLSLKRGRKDRRVQVIVQGSREIRRRAAGDDHPVREGCKRDDWRKRGNYCCTNTNRFGIELFHRRKRGK